MCPLWKPNKVLSLSQWNKASPGTGAGGYSNNTTARNNSSAFFIACTFGQLFCTIFPHRDVDLGGVFKRGVRGALSSLTLITNISLVWDFSSLQASGIFLWHTLVSFVTLSKEKEKPEIASYDPFKGKKGFPIRPNICKEVKETVVTLENFLLLLHPSVYPAFAQGPLVCTPFAT